MNRTTKQQKTNDSKYINIPIYSNCIKFVGTSNRENTHEFYKNSQFFVMQYEDKKDRTYEFKAEVKLMRVDLLKEQLVLNVDKTKNVAIGIFESENINYVQVTYDTLFKLVNDDISVYDILK